MCFRKTIETDSLLSEIGRLEEFIRSCTELTETEKNKFLIISAETFENIVGHSNSPGRKIRIRIRKRRDKRLSMMFLFRSNNFEVFIRNRRSSSPYYDPATRRYRGLGITICYNLSQTMQYRVTPNYNVIVITI